MKNLLFLFLFLPILIYSQSIQKVEPPFWWSEMQSNELQLLVYGENISDCSIELSQHINKVSLIAVTQLQNPNYLIIDLEIAENAKTGTFDIHFKKEGKTIYTYAYELKQRRDNSAERKGFNSSDVIYLITPDRFANGNPDNDAIEGLTEQPNRKDKDGRHGGDIQGIANHLDYIEDMGFTAIWVNPVLENNMQHTSYHGYSTTDFYKIDGRFGTNKEYQKLIQQTKKRNIKTIMDVIVNHCGSEHWFVKDLPMSDWLNHQSDFENEKYHLSSHRKTVIADPYVAGVDVEDMTDGWFWYTMPDLNQRNKYLANYLIQNTIWWIEFADLDGLRMDTHPYADKDFMTEWTCRVMTEYPNFNIVGEIWHQNPNVLAYWQRGKVNTDGYVSCLPSVMDFPLQFSVRDALIEEEHFEKGWSNVYRALANDFVYADPLNLVIFPDNHDMSRFFTQMNEEYDLFKLGITYFLTTRGIPQIYYGTEILMKNSGTTEHGIIRTDFPGGWQDDEVNGFTGKGLTKQERDAQAFFKKLLNWRKNNIAIHDGKVLHYNPKDGVYVFFRMTDTDNVMVILSKNEKTVELDIQRFRQGLGDAKVGEEVISGKSIDLSKNIKIPAKSPMIIEF